MPNSILSQRRLAAEPRFATSVAGALITHAFVVKAEGPPVQSSPVTPTEAAAMNTHLLRQRYAEQVISNLDAEAHRWLRIIVMRPNVFAFATSFDFVQDQFVTLSGDVDILQQVVIDWNIFAGA